jgi:hypothetical protein
VAVNSSLALLPHGRHVPTLIAGIEPAGSAVALQGATEVVRPDCQAKFPREILEDFFGTSTLGVCAYRFQSGLTQRCPPRRLAASPLGRCTGRRRSFPHASLPWLLGWRPFSAKSFESTFGDFQLIELIAQLCSFRIEPHEPLGNALLVLSDLVQHSHLKRSP